jgi:hypothetical protein
MPAKSNHAIMIFYQRSEPVAKARSTGPGTAALTTEFSYISKSPFSRITLRQNWKTGVIVIA